MHVSVYVYVCFGWRAGVRLFACMSTCARVRVCRRTCMNEQPHAQVRMYMCGHVCELVCSFCGCECV